MHKPLDQVVAVLACLVVAILLLAFLIQFCRERERKSTSEKVRIFFGLKSMFLHLHMNQQDSQKGDENEVENVNGTKTSFVFLNFSKSPTR